MSDHSHPEAGGTIPTSIEVSFLELNIKRSRILPKGSLEPEALKPGLLFRKPEGEELEGQFR